MKGVKMWAVVNTNTGDVIATYTSKMDACNRPGVKGSRTKTVTPVSIVPAYILDALRSAKKDLAPCINALKSPDRGIRMENVLIRLEDIQAKLNALDTPNCFRKTRESDACIPVTVTPTPEGGEG